MKSILLSLLCLFLVKTGLASDHIDGAPTLTNGQADLSDLYAFPTPEKSNNLTLILNTYPGVSQTGHFSSKVAYVIEMRKAELSAPAPGLSFQSFDVVKLYCEFSDPAHHHGAVAGSGQVNCALTLDEQPLSQLSGSVGKILQNETLKIFAGPRTDSFFLAVSPFQGVTERKGFPGKDPGAKNAMHTINVLSLVFEIDFASLGMDVEKLALSAQSYNPLNGTNIDRVGRPEITNLTMHAFNGAEPLKRLYNQLPQFAVASSFQEKFQKRFYENIQAYDQLDGTTDWSEQGLQDFSKVLVEDALLVDLKGACVPGANDYLAIEKALLQDLEVSSCGGRDPEDDIMATLYALYIGGLEADPTDFATGVSVPYQGNAAKSLSLEFPYLATAGQTSFLQKALLNILIMGQE